MVKVCSRNTAQWVILGAPIGYQQVGIAQFRWAGSIVSPFIRSPLLLLRSVGGSQTFAAPLTPYRL